MAESVTGPILLGVYMATVALSAPAALAVVLLARGRSVPSALGSVVGVLAGVVTLAATVALALVSPAAGLVLFLAGQGVIVGCCLVPLAVGGTIVGWTSDLDREAALRAAVIAWPLALALSFAVFVAPGGFAQSDIADLSGIGAVLAWSVWVETILFGPGVLGAVGTRLGRRLR